jgi:hypothetical protein
MRVADAAAYKPPPRILEASYPWPSAAAEARPEVSRYSIGMTTSDKLALFALALVCGLGLAGGLTLATSDHPSMLVGINGGNWGPAGAADQVALGGLVRAEDNAGRSPAQFWQAGGHVILLLSACDGACSDGSGQGYSVNGVEAINPTLWASNAVARFQSDCAGSAINCPAVEVLNEPSERRFWGPNAGSQAETNAYAVLLKDAYTAFHNQYGSGAPKILGSLSDTQPWDSWLRSASSYVDEVTVHPYGQYTDANYGEEGETQVVAAVHNESGKPVWITEVGWETNTPAGGHIGWAYNWTYAEQAANIYNFVNWARAQRYIAAVVILDYTDVGTATGGNWWGVRNDINFAHKPSFRALQEAAQGKSCTTCN